MPTFVPFHEPGPGWKQGVPHLEQPGIEAHVEFARRLVAEDHLLIGGPFADAEGGGMMVIQAESFERARDLANEDASIGKLLGVTVRPWRIAISTIDLPGASPGDRPPAVHDRLVPPRGAGVPNSGR